MKDWNWNSQPQEGFRLHSGWAVGLGVILALGILLWILSPFHSAPPVPQHPHSGIQLPPPSDGPESSLDRSRATERLLDAIIQIESRGNPERVGGKGERGLMQIMEGTWQEVTRRHLGEEIPFDRAFEPELNRRVGRYYLGDLQVFLYRHRDKWRSDLRSLLLACYNAGPERVRKSGFDLKRLPESVQSYARRGSALHDSYLSGEAETMHEVLIRAADSPEERQ